MKTTALFVELLVVGAQASITIVLVIVLVFGVEWIVVGGDVIGPWSLPVSFIALSLIYTMGIAIERIAGIICPVHRLVSIVESVPLLKNKVNHAVNPVRRMRFQQGAGVSDAEYTLSRIRIIRAALINVSIWYIILLVSAFVAPSTKFSILCAVVVISGIFVVLAVTTVSALLALTVAYVGIVKVIEEMNRDG